MSVRKDEIVVADVLPWFLCQDVLILALPIIQKSPETGDILSCSFKVGIGIQLDNLSYVFQHDRPAFVVEKAAVE